MPDPLVAFECPACKALAALSIVGDPKGHTMLHCNECGSTSPTERWRVGEFVPAEATSSTDGLGGNLIGPKDEPYGRNNQIVDTRNAVILDFSTYATAGLADMAENPSDGLRFATLLFEGRVNRSKKRSRVLYMLGADGCAAIVSELVALAVREGGDFEAEFAALLAERMGKMP